MSLIIRALILIIAIAMGLWNYFWRDNFSIPYLSGLCSVVVYIIAVAILLVEEIWSFKASRKKRRMEAMGMHR